MFVSGRTPHLTTLVPVSIKGDQNPKETASSKELLLSNMQAQEALVNLLEKKGILTKKEVLKEMKRLRVEAEKKRGY